MKFAKVLSLILVLILAFTFSSCGKVDHNYGVKSEEEVVESVKTKTDDQNKITSLDNKMSKFFDISLFDEENYSKIYLGKKFEIKAVYDGTQFILPTKIDVLEASGWSLAEGSDYNKNSLIYAKETVELIFVNQNGSKLIALFYNPLNTSVRFSECSIVKIRISNGYIKNAYSYSQFNICGVTNTSVITDVVQILGTPSHFYKKTENSYYFDYFIEESDRRNKIRLYIDLNNDAVTAVEFSNYKI